MTRSRIRRMPLEILEHRQLLTATVDVSVDSSRVYMSSEAAEPPAAEELVTPFPEAFALGDISAPELTAGLLNEGERTEFYSFELDRASTVYVVLFNTASDLSLGIFDRTGEIRAQAQTPGLEGERISVELSAGTYYLMVLGEGETNTIYQLALVSLPLYGDVYESAGVDQGGDSFGRATKVGPLTSQRTYDDSVGGADPADVYRFEMPSAARAFIGLQDLTGPLDLHIFDLKGQLVARSRNANTQSEALAVDLQAGEYYVLVFPTSSASAGYRLSMSSLASLPSRDNTTSTPTTPSPTVPGSTGTVTPPLATTDAGDSFSRSLELGSMDESSWVRREAVGGTDATDVFRFRLPSAGRVAVELRGMTADLDLYLFDANQRVVARNYQAGTATERVEANLSTADHFLLVIPHGPVESAYELAMETTGMTPSPAPVDDSDRLTNVPEFGSSLDWNLNRIHAPEAWAAGYTGRNVVVAVIDSGVDRTHEDLQSSLWQNEDEIPGDGIDNDRNGYVDDRYGWNFVDGNSNIADPTGHGTHIAGIIASARNGVGSTGVAYDARVMALRVLEAGGGGRTSSVASAIIYAVDQGADIISLSLFSDGYSSSIENSLIYAQQKGVLVVAASGNQGAALPNYPARHSHVMDNVLSVGAHTPGDERATFSNRVGASGAVQIDAPGVSINSTVPVDSYGLWYGTSMATPHVAAAAALILSANPRLSPAEVRATLVQSAQRAIAGSDSVGGLDLAAAIPLALKTNANRAVAAAWESINWMPVREEQLVFSNGQADRWAAWQFEVERPERERRLRAARDQFFAHLAVQFGHQGRPE